ncbi:MAG: hypothetical protein IT426_07030 [Pirellulales bacterium]|nr:hypothetical protein [Pirellulales bacterium]
MYSFTLEQGSGFGTMLLVLAAAILLAGVFYLRAFGQLKRGQWQTLLLLRSLAILLVVMLIFRPVYSHHKQLTNKPGLIFLLDRSASMSIADDTSGVTRFNQGRGQIEKWREKLQNDFDLRVVEFAENARPLKDFSELKALAPDGASTSLAGAIAAAGRQMPRRDVEAVVLLSDGINNSARNPLEAADKAGLRLHAIGVGASLRTSASYRDVQVSSIDCPDRMTLGNLARISASVEGIGLPGRVVHVELEEDGNKIAEQELALGPNQGDSPIFRGDGAVSQGDVHLAAKNATVPEGAQSVTFDFRPTVKGKHTYTVKIPPLAEEKIAENNRRSAISLVVEAGIKVLYLEGTLRAEYGALVDRFLAKDPDLQFYALVQTRPNVFLKRTNMNGIDLAAIPKDAETFGKFDVFVLGDLDSSYFRSEQQELLVKRIREGAGLVMLGGYHSLGPGGYAGTLLGNVLPLQLGGREIGQATDPFLPTLTPDGARHPIFANIAGFFPSEQGPAKMPGLPPLDGCTKVESARPGATVLAKQSADKNAMPVLAVQPLDKGRTAIFTGDTTRKWQQGPKAMNQESPFLRFWGQMVRWLAGRAANLEAGANLAATLDKAYYDPEEGIRISATVRDKEGQAASTAKVIAKITGPDGKSTSLNLAPEPGSPGRYDAVFDPPAAGEYQFDVSATLGNERLTTDKLAAEVGRANLEFEKLDLDDKLLARLAAYTKGRYLHISSADLLLDQLDRSNRSRSEFSEGKLYNPPLCWTLFVGLLTLEWILRKKYQLR